MKKIISLLLMVFGSQSLAATPSFINVTKSDFESLTKEFSGNFAHPSVMGAASLGKIFGFELSLVAGQTASPEIDKIVKASSGNSFPNLYHAGLLLAVSVPFGITGELVYTPKLSSNDVNFQATSAAVKLTLNEDLLTVIPFNLAFRAFSTSSALDFKQTVSSIEGTVENKNAVTGLQMLLSPSLPLLEPYVGFGLLQAKDTLSYSGSTTIFNTTVTDSTSADTSLSSTQILAGINAHLLLISLGLEYSKAFDASRYTAKLGFVF